MIILLNHYHLNYCLLQWYFSWTIPLELPSIGAGRFCKKIDRFVPERPSPPPLKHHLPLSLKTVRAGSITRHLSMENTDGIEQFFHPVFDAYLLQGGLH